MAAGFPGTARQRGAWQSTFIPHEGVEAIAHDRQETRLSFLNSDEAHGLGRWSINVLVATCASYAWGSRHSQPSIFSTSRLPRQKFCGSQEQGSKSSKLVLRNPARLLCIRVEAQAPKFLRIVRGSFIFFIVGREKSQLMPDLCSVLQAGQSQALVDLKFSDRPLRRASLMRADTLLKRLSGCKDTLSACQFAIEKASPLQNLTMPLGLSRGAAVSSIALYFFSYPGGS